MLLKHSTSIALHLIPIYNTTMHKNKSSFALKVDTYWCYDETLTYHKQDQGDRLEALEFF